MRPSVRQVFWVVMAGLLLVPSPSHAKAMYGKAALVVRDAASMAPLSGVSLTLQYAGNGESQGEKVEVERNAGTTDETGYAEARVYVGRSQTKWAPFAGMHQTKRMDVRTVHVTAEKPGYQPFRDTVPVFYSAFRKGKGTYIFLDEVALAPAGSSQVSRSLPQGFIPKAEVEPSWGDDQTRFALRVRFEVPAVLAHEYKEPLLDPTAATELTPAPVTLKDDGKAPDAAAGDGVYSGFLTPKELSQAAAVARMEIEIDTRSSQHSLVTPATKTISTSEGSIFFGGQKRRKSAVVLVAPIRWAVGPTPEEARRTFEQRFPAASP